MAWWIAAWNSSQLINHFTLGTTLLVCMILMKCKQILRKRSVANHRSTLKLQLFGTVPQDFLKCLPWIRALVKKFVIIISANSMFSEVYDMGINLHLLHSKISKMDSILCYDKLFKKIFYLFDFKSNKFWFLLA